MSVAASTEELASLLSIEAAEGASIFGLDGMDGAGKTPEASALASRLGWSVVHLDDHLHLDQETYVEHLNYSAISKAMAAASRPVLVEGVCLLEVTARLGVAIDVHIYIKRYCHTGFWADEDECIFECTCDERIEELEAQARLFLNGKVSGPAISAFRKEVIRYHDTWRPSESAKHVLHRIEGGA